MTKDEWYRQLFERLDNSKFRSSFHLKQKDIDYINEKGLDTIRQHAADFIAKREAPAYIANDGKQTPMRGHPVFIAQHATATCCRECIRKWHKITAIIPNMVNSRFPLLLRIIKIPIVITENKYTVSNKVSTIACIIKILS